MDYKLLKDLSDELSSKMDMGGLEIQVVKADYPKGYDKDSVSYVPSCGGGIDGGRFVLKVQDLALSFYDEPELRGHVASGAGLLKALGEGYLEEIYKGTEFMESGTVISRPYTGPPVKSGGWHITPVFGYDLRSYRARVRNRLDLSSANQIAIESGFSEEIFAVTKKNIERATGFLSRSVGGEIEDPLEQTLRSPFSDLMSMIGDYHSPPFYATGHGSIGKSVDFLDKAYMEVQALGKKVLSGFDRQRELMTMKNPQKSDVVMENLLQIFYPSEE